MKYILSLLFILFSTLSQANSSSIESYSYHHLRLGNTKEVFQFLRNLSEFNNVEALFLLGMMHLNGDGTVQNMPYANTLFEKSAALGNAAAYKALADSYLTGDGVGIDLKMALNLYQKSADLGYGPGQFNCGIMLKNGDGAPVNLPLAYYYLCLASSNPDLDEMQLDAAACRDQIGALLTPTERQEVFTKIGQLSSVLTKD